MQFFDLSAEIFLVLMATGFCAGFVDSIAGGGGLIALPVLLFVGIPPQMALGTNKFQGSFGTFIAAFNFIRKKEVTLRNTYIGIIVTFAGACLGAWSIQRLDAEVVKHLIPVLLLLIFFYTVFSKNFGKEKKSSILKMGTFFLIFGPLLGFYDGFFGPGTGSFWTVTLLIFTGVNLTKAIGNTKIMNFTSNIVALGMFIIGGNVHFIAGLAMATGTLIGAYLGSNLAIKRGAEFIRPIFLTVVIVSVLRLLYLNYAHLL
ncbi:MAG: TSUP family transporter [Proteobacteria bacterium]|nr:TSUP family transporter [Pseudomonadota bacterium]